MNRIDGVEIFRCGVWKSKQFTEDDLDEMVTNWREFKDTWFKPAIKTGHDNTPGKPAIGYLDNLRRVGAKLVADFVDLPTKFYKMIKDKRYDRVSAEIAPNLTKGGKSYGRVLSAVAILGHEIPEVTGLRPLREYFTSKCGFFYESYTTPLTIQKEVNDMTTEEAGIELDKRVQEYMFQHPAMDYQSAMYMIFQADPQLKVQYSCSSSEGIETYSEYPAGKFSQKEISEEVHRRIETLMKENPALSYPEAMISVLQEDKELANAYHGSYYPQVK